MKLNLNITFGESIHLAEILSITKSLEIKMATLEELFIAVRAEQDLVVSIVTVTNGLVEEVKALVAASGAVVPGLDQLLTDVQANTAAMIDAVAAGTAAEGLVPAPVPAPVA